MKPLSAVVLQGCDGRNEDQVITRKVIHYRQEPDPAPIEELTAHEVRGPTLINPSGHRSLHTPLATYMPLRLLGPQHQAFLALQPLDSLVVHCLAPSLQQDVEAQVAHPRPGLVVKGGEKVDYCDWFHSPWLDSAHEDFPKWESPSEKFAIRYRHTHRTGLEP